MQARKKLEGQLADCPSPAYFAHCRVNHRPRMGCILRRARWRVSEFPWLAPKPLKNNRIGQVRSNTPR